MFASFFKELNITMLILLSTFMAYYRCMLRSLFVCSCCGIALFMANKILDMFVKYNSCMLLMWHSSYLF
jgi:hypothetical protein